MQGDFGDGYLTQTLGEQYVDVTDFLRFLASELGFKLAWAGLGQDALRARDAVRTSLDTLEDTFEGFYALVKLHGEQQPLHIAATDSRARRGVIFVCSVAIVAIQNYYEPDALPNEFCEKMKTFNLSEILRALRLLNAKLA